MDELIDRFNVKDAIYDLRNAKLSDADMEIWYKINELPADMSREKVIQQMEALKLKDVENEKYTDLEQSNSILYSNCKGRKKKRLKWLVM